MKIDLKKIPKGGYCYDKKGICPYWTLDPNHPEQDNGYCSFLKKGDWQTGGYLWDQIKECEINDDEDYYE